MRIGLISKEYPPETGWGGIGTYVHRIAHALAGIGHEVHVISRSDRVEEYVRQDGNVTVHRIREKKWRFPGSDWLYWQAPISEWHYSQRVREVVLALHAQAPFDILEVPEYRAEGLHLAAYGAPAPLVVKLHTPTYVLNEALLKPWSLREWLVNKIERRSTLLSTAIMSPSSDLMRRVKKDWDLPIHRLTVFPYPADPALASPEPWPEETVEPTLLYVGRINPMKGSDVLGEAIIDVLKAVPNGRFILVGAPGDKAVLGGDTALFNRMKRRWEQAGLLDRIELVPWQRDASKMREYYRRSHVVVIPSRYDNFPNVLLEAMACGRAVVGSSVGGIAEVVSPNVSGLLVPPADGAALCKALITLLSDLPRARQFGIAGQKIIAEQLSPPLIARKTTDWYANIIALWKKRFVGISVLAISTERWINWQQDEGVSIVVPEFLSGMERQGMDVRFIRRPYQPKRPRAWGHKGLLGSLMGIWDIATDAAEVPGEILFVLWRWLKAPQRFDLIWERQSLYGFSGWLISWLTGRPLILNVDAPLIQEYEQLQGLYFGAFRRSLGHWLLRRNLHRAKAVHVPSAVLGDWMAKDYQVPRAKFHVIPNGVNTEVFQRRMDSHSARKRYGLGVEPVVLFLGSLQPWHGCEVLIKAFAQVHQQCPEAHLLIVGDGKMRQSLTEQAVSLNLIDAVRFIGQVPHRQVPELLVLADIAVLPYPELPMPFYFSPIKLFEYMSAGKAIVASRIGQIAELLRDGQTARLVTPGSAEELAEALIHVIQSPDRGASLGVKARALASHYTWKQQGDAVAGICLQALKASAQ